MADKSIGPGTVLAGRFRLEDLLQETAGAKFWRATDQTLARSVAVHVLAANDPRAEALLVAARASANVTDGHFLRVLDAAEEDGVAYVVNEWAAGSSLDLMLTEGPLPSRRAAWLVKEVAEAIAIAHRHGVAHGRLIPENVMVTETGSVKLIGFVIDSVLNGAPEPPAPGIDPGGHPLGDFRSDVVNLASLLYATLVGRWPGSHGSKLADAPREHGRPLRPRKVRAGVPRPLDAICERVLNPEAHLQAGPIETAREISAALTDFIGNQGGNAQAGHEPTTVMSRGDLPGSGAKPDSAPDPTSEEEPGGTESTLHQANLRDGPPGHRDATQVEVSSSASPPNDDSAGGPPWSSAAAAGERMAAEDPEATQAGEPVFFDDDTGVGWAAPSESATSPDSRAGGRRASPPPPFPPDPDAKPLFAPDSAGGRNTRPRTAESDPTGHRTGHGTGSVPAVWGPDVDNSAPPGESRPWEPKDAGKSWLRLAAIIAACLLLVLVGILALNFGRGSGEPEPSAEGSGSSRPSEDGEPGTPLAIAGVSDFDPEGDPPEENPDLTGLAFDGDPSTAWRTKTYYNNPQLGGLKDGVGLVVDLGKPVEVSQVQLTLIGLPTDLQLFAADEGAGQPTSTEGLQEVAAAEEAGPKVSLELEEPTTTQYLVVWLTSLPPVEGGFAGQIAEIVVRS